MSENFNKYVKTDYAGRTINPETLEKWLKFTGPVFTNGKIIRCVCNSVHEITKHKRSARKIIKCPNFGIEVKAASFNHLVDKWIIAQVPIIEAIEAAQKIKEEKEDK